MANKPPDRVLRRVQYAYGNGPHPFTKGHLRSLRKKTCGMPDEQAERIVDQVILFKTIAEVLPGATIIHTSIETLAAAIGVKGNSSPGQESQ